MEKCIVTEIYSPFYCGFTCIDNTPIYFECIDRDENLISTVQLYKVEGMEHLIENEIQRDAYWRWTVESNQPDVVADISEYLKKFRIEELINQYPKIEQKTWEKALQQNQRCIIWEEFLESIDARRPDFYKKARFLLTTTNPYHQGEIEWIR